MYVCSLSLAIFPLSTEHTFTCPVGTNDISRTFRWCRQRGQLRKIVVPRPLLTISVAGAQIRHATTPTFLQALLPLSCTTCLRIRYITQTSPPLGSAQSALSHSLSLWLLSLTLSLCACFTPRQFLLVSSALNLAPFEPSLSEKTFSSSRVGFTENLLGIC